MRLTKESLTQHLLKSEARSTAHNSIPKPSELQLKLGAVSNDAARETVSSKQIPDVELLCRLDKARLVRLLQHFLSVPHEPIVLQQPLVLFHLSLKFV